MKFLHRLLLLVMVMPVLVAHAHQIGLSTLVLQLDKEVLVAQLTMARSDVESKVLVDEDLDGIVTERELRAATPAMKRFAQDSLQIEWGGRRVAPRSISIRMLESSAFEFSLEYPRNPAKDLTIQSFMPALLPFGHQQDLKLLDEGGELVTSRLLVLLPGQSIST